MYTARVCISSYADMSGPKVMRIDNFERKDRHTTVLVIVDEVRVNALGIVLNDQVSTLRLSRCECICRFVMKKTLGFLDVEKSDQRWTSKPFSTVIHLSKVTKLSLCSGYPPRFNRIKYDYLIELLQQTLRIHSLTLDPSGSILLVRQPIEDISSGIIQCVDRSKLRYLGILVTDILSSRSAAGEIHQSVQYPILFPRGIDQFRRTHWICDNIDAFSVSIWIDQRVKTTNACQRLERSNFSKDASILSLTDPSGMNSFFVRLLQKHCDIIQRMCLTRN